MSNEVSGVRGGYDRWAAVYDHDANPLQALEEPRVWAAVGDVRGWSVLDLGCGTGRHSLWLAAVGATVTAVDFSEGMLAEARRKPGADAVRFVAHDLHTPLPFADASFDLVVSGLVLEHLRELDHFFAEARRVLKSGGRAVVSAMHPAMFLRGTQARFTDPSSGELVQPGSVPHSVGAFVMAAVRAGFGLSGMDEFAPDAAFAAQFPRAEKYVGWPMLVVLRLNQPQAVSPGNTGSPDTIISPNSDDTPMNETAIHTYLTSLAGVQTVEKDGDIYYFVGSEHMFPFVTLVTGDRHDTVSNLDRPGVYRLNVGVSKTTFQSLFPKGEGEPDYAALDQILPHPVYGKMYWVCVLNPSVETFETVKSLITEAHETAAKKAK
jgi:SAM-dependent methyltransferase